MLAVTALTVVRTRSLFAIVALSGVFSLLSALLFITWDAVDVAFTEAAVGAGISTVLMLGTLALTSRTEKTSHKSNLIPLIAVVLTGAAMIYGTLDMPKLRFGRYPSTDTRWARLFKTNSRRYTCPKCSNSYFSKLPRLRHIG